MFDWFKKLFGEGMIRFEMTTADGRTGVGKVSYIGDLSTLDREEFKRDMIRQSFVQHGERVVDVKIIGYY